MNKENMTKNEYYYAVDGELSEKVADRSVSSWQYFERAKRRASVSAVLAVGSAVCGTELAEEISLRNVVSTAVTLIGAVYLANSAYDYHLLGQSDRNVIDNIEAHKIIERISRR